jgi:cytochrome c oxidase accessory protein FixG
VASGLGDCVACRQCVVVCPTGIDIRDGTQMECVNCTACIDACDAVMDKIGRPRGLIRFASLNNIERGERQRFTPRMKLYLIVLTALVTLFLFLVFTRAEVETTLLRAPGALFQTTPDGKIQNLYLLKVVNKTTRDMPIELKLENLAGDLRIMGGGNLVVPKVQLAQTSVLIEVRPQHLRGASTKLEIGVYSKGKRLETVKTVLAGPRTNP